MIEWIKSIFSSQSDSVSSKRVIGVLAWLAVLLAYIHCAVTGKSMPECTIGIITAASALLSVDSVMKKTRRNSAN